MIRIRTKLQTNVRPATKKICMILEVLHLIAFMVQVTEQLDCGTYRAENGKICHMCNPGNYKIGDCMEDGMSARCLPCPNGTYETACNQALSCASCSLYCPYYYSTKVSECNKTSDIKCQCNTGFHFEGDVNGKCIKHKSCPAGQGVKMQGTPIGDTVCEPCIPGKTFSNVSSSIQQCRNCTICMTIVNSECTPVSDTVCATAAVDMAHVNGSPDIAIAVSVTFAGLCLIGLLLFYLWRQKIISCSNYCGLPTISVQQQLYKVDEGKSVKIIAQVKNTNAITWTLNGELLVPGLNGYNYFSVENPSLLLTHAVHSHGGEYILKASNNYIRSVSSPPIILTVTAFRQSTDIQMDAGPIDQSDRDVHDDHMRLAALHQSPNNNNGRNQTYLKKYHHNVCIEEPADDPTPSDISRIPTGFRQSPNIQMGVEPIGERDVDDVHIHLAAEHHSSSENYQDDTIKKEKVTSEPSDSRKITDNTVRRILKNLARNIGKDFDMFFRELFEATASESDGDRQDVDALIQQMHINYPKNVVEANYQLLKNWSERYGRADENFCTIISNTLRNFGANMLLSNLQMNFGSYFPINGGNDNPVRGEIQITFPT